MGNLFGTLLTSAGSMRVFERALDVIQNNVSNASTPGYVKQRLTLESQRFQPETGFAGGVAAGDIESLRSGYAERAVWRQQELFGRLSQKTDDLSRLESVLPVAQDAGIPAALSAFFQSFSSLAVAPNDTVSRQVVLDRATDLAATFREVATGLATASVDASRQAGNVAESINRLGEEIRGMNQEQRWNASTHGDAGIDARMHATLEQLAELADITAIQEPDGSTMVLLGGQTPLVIGDKLRPVSVDTSGPQAVVTDVDGQDMTGTVLQGRLGALIELKNKILPSYRDHLNRLAQEFADGINDQLRLGVDANGQTPPTDLFRYDSDLGAAVTIDVNALAPADLAAAAADAPGGNGNALTIAAMATSDRVDDLSFTGFYGKLAAQLGRNLEGARAGRNTQEQLLSQARSLRQDVSGVSLDEEAMHLIQFQHAYQAAAKLITVINDMTETLIGLVR